MKRRTFLQSGLAATFSTSLFAALRQERLDDAAEVLTKATANGQIASAVLHVTQREASFSRRFGSAKSEQAMFLLGSIERNMPGCRSSSSTRFARR